MSSCSRRSTKTPMHVSTPILVSDIYSLSICITLDIPYSIACRNCKPQLNPYKNTRENKKLNCRSLTIDSVRDIGSFNMPRRLILQKVM